MLDQALEEDDDGDNQSMMSSEAAEQWWELLTMSQLFINQDYYHKNDNANTVFIENRLQMMLSINCNLHLERESSTPVDTCNDIANIQL